MRETEPGQETPRDEAERRIREVWDWLKRENVPVHGWISAITGVALIVVTCGQLVVSCNNARETSPLVGYARESTMAAKDSAAAAQSFSTEAGTISGHIGNAVLTMQDQSEQSKRLTEASEKAFAFERSERIDVERARIYYDGILTQPVYRANGRYTWEISVRWQDAGETGAEHLIAFAKIQSLDDREYRAMDFTVHPGDPVAKGFVPPRQPFYIAGNDEPWNFAKDLENGLHIVYWGWAGYRDIFAYTAAHITEFCVELTEVQGPVDQQGKVITTRPDQMRFTYRDCIPPKDDHNCTDEACKDYAETSKYVR